MKKKMNSDELISLIRDIIKGDVKLSSHHYIKCKRFDISLPDILGIYDMSKMDIDNFVNDLLYTEGNYLLYKENRLQKLIKRILK